MSMFKVIEIVTLLVYYTIPVGFTLFRHLWGITVQPFKTTLLAKDH